MSRELFDPPDALEAHDAWGANCGPCALAAVLGIPVADVRRLFDGFDSRRYVNPTHMQAALTAAGATWNRGPKSCLPDYGLAFLQLTGPWEAPGVPVAAAYRHTHWIGSALLPWTDPPQIRVYDVNDDGWCPLAHWKANVMPLVVRANRRATGWRIRSTIEVQHG